MRRGGQTDSRGAGVAGAAGAAAAAAYVEWTHVVT